MAPLLHPPHDLFSAWLVGVVSHGVEQPYFKSLYEDILRLVCECVPSIHELPQPDIMTLCSSGCAEAMLELGDRYTWGNFQHCIPCDFAVAAGWLQKSAVLGNANAHATLSALYWRGNGVSKDRVAAYFHAQESYRLGIVRMIKNGDGSSACRALTIKRIGIDLGPDRDTSDMEGKVDEREREILNGLPDLRERGFNAFGHWKKQCMCMSAIASLHVEHMPGYCRGIEQTEEQSSRRSDSRTGLAFPNKATAIAALHTLSDQNFARAQFELGLAYSVGNGVPQNHITAVEQLEKAAFQTEPGANFILARYFETGLGGIPMNPERAKCCKLAVIESGIDFTDLVLHSR